MCANQMASKLFLLWYVMLCITSTMAYYDEQNCTIAGNITEEFNFKCGKGVLSNLVDNKHKRIYLVVTNDPIVQIMARIAGIYLRERMGYDDVYLHTLNNTPLSVGCGIFNQFELMSQTFASDGAAKIMHFGMTMSGSYYTNYQFSNANMIKKLGTTRQYGWFYPKQLQNSVYPTSLNLYMFKKQTNWPIDFISNVTELGLDKTCYTESILLETRRKFIKR